MVRAIQNPKKDGNFEIFLELGLNRIFAKKNRAFFSNHDFLITTCQWYSKDSSVFVTSSMDQTVKIWDANMMCHVEKFTFENPVDQIHWSVAKSKFPLIAVAQSSSNIQLIDPR